MPRPCLFALWVCLSAISQSAVAEFQNIAWWSGENNQRLDASVRYIEDVNKTLDFEQVSELSPTAWQVLPEKGASFGLTPSTYWFQVDIGSDRNEMQALYLMVDYPVLDHIDFFDMHQGEMIDHASMGDWDPFSDRLIDHRSFVYPLSIAKGDIHKVFVRVETQGSMKVPMTLWEQDSFWLAQLPAMTFYGVFVGILLVMSVYNLFLFVSLRDWSYFFYSTLTLGTLGFNITIDGVAYQWLWPNAPLWHNLSMFVFNGVSCMSLALFALFYLNPDKKSIVRRGLVSLGALPPLLLLISFVLVFVSQSWYQSMAGLNALMAIAVYGGSAVLVASTIRRSGSQVLFFLLAWSAFILGGVFKAISLMGGLPNTLFFEYIHVFGAVIGVVVLSFALADKIRMEREAKELAQQQSIGNLKKFFSLYKNASEGIFVLDIRGRLQSANPAFLNLLGVEALDELRDVTKSNNGLLLDVSEYEKLLRIIQQEKEVVNYETQLHDSHGKRLWVSVTARVTFDEEKKREQIEGTLVDIHERKEFESELKQLATYDSLTGFLNRHAFEQQVKSLLRDIKATSSVAALLYLDLDQFKLVNDLCGHSAGDKLLQALSFRLQNKLQAYGTEPMIARLGGDEFGILLPGHDEQHALEVAEDLRETVETFIFVWDGHRYPIGVSVGLVNIDAYHYSLEQLLMMADTACYMAKDQGRNRVHVFAESDRDIQFRKREMQWLSTIREAMEHNHFFLVAQPIKANKREFEGIRYEVLLRLNKQDQEVISPHQFLPAAERYRLMPSIDRWVIETFFSWLKKNPAHQSALKSASINLSTQSLGEPSFADSLLKAFKDYQIPPNKICFEITESMAITHLDNTQSFIKRFRELGCRFALDDFGTGFSSYAYLKELMVDYIKVDGMFVRNLETSQVDEAMVQSVHQVAATMGIESIAEFVENEAIQKKLESIGIDYSQGYFIDKPMPLDELLDLGQLDAFQQTSA